MTRILIVTDAWHPQVNGVVRSLDRLGLELKKQGRDVHYLTPLCFKTLPCPTYPEIRLSLTLGHGVAKKINAIKPDYVHIATEGPLGFWARRYCMQRHVSFTTSYHTRFPEYLAARFPVPVAWTYAALRWFHNAGRCCMVATPSLKRDLEDRGFTDLHYWGRGVDLELFHPRNEKILDDAKPLLLYVGRVAVEKNINAFLELDCPGTKIVVGDGPQRPELEAKHPEVYFLGLKEGEELAAIYASCDVFVFPSKTDTFGIVLLEALASGLPVAAYPVMGPLDVIGDSSVGALNDDLATAVREALKIDRQACVDYAAGFSWEASAKQFQSNIEI
ncbi:glycosyltransferase family 4 protein [Cohaesibacter celericrescens]|uniref:Alpha-mannosyltransferase n=1 Tax=Cohaesibacter celericrescens TaxID=2067669 RepID=A0A2N5XLQ8_9HYPH|nr:glycosyltransferase family 1 protein [Cohaesibacter celericrescens]PLW75466.1 alpha-mannosyltransferase [Cohaesibacter celericrescens]PLW78873.1 alpha-mannosyltransferase [Cohaesibacter celericrescens]